MLLQYTIKGEPEIIEYTVKENVGLNKNEMNTLQICGNVEKDGLIIELQVFKSSNDFKEYYNNKNKEIKYETITALIDTGADRTAISKEFIEKIQLEENGIVKSIGFGNIVTESKKYKSIFYNRIFKHRALSIEVVENDFTEQHYNAILGRDFLVNFTLIYDGWSNTFRLINVTL